MRIVVLERDLIGLWDLKGVYTVVAETKSAYEVKVFGLFKRWIPKKAVGIRCEVVEEDFKKIN